jgi:hypothetical protein
MAGVLLLGYGLIKWSGRANEQANDGDSGITNAISTGSVGLRPVATFTRTSKASDQGTNQGNNGGEA